MALEIKEGGLDDARVIALLKIHVTSASAQTVPESAHPLDLDRLRAPDIRFWCAWDDESLMGFAALKRLSTTHGEVKSMHTAQRFRRRGVASSLLKHVISAARSDGMKRLSLETGSMDFFRPARDMYAKHGFVICGPFGDYVLDPNSTFMTMELVEPNRARSTVKEKSIAPPPEAAESP